MPKHVGQELRADRRFTVAHVIVRLWDRFGRLANCGRFGDPTGFTTGCDLAGASR